MSSIKLSPKHGLNPSISQCFFCGGDKGEIVLAGRMPKDAEAPMRMVVNYEPCETCRQQFAKGILVIGVTTHSPDSRPPIADGYYPSGQYMVMDEDHLIRLVGGKEAALPALASRKCLVNQSVLDEISKAQKGQ